MDNSGLSKERTETTKGSGRSAVKSVEESPPNDLAEIQSNLKQKRRSNSDARTEKPLEVQIEEAKVRKELLSSLLSRLVPLLQASSQTASLSSLSSPSIPSLLSSKLQQQPILPHSASSQQQPQQQPQQPKAQQQRPKAQQQQQPLPPGLLPPWSSAHSPFRLQPQQQVKKANLLNKIDRIAVDEFILNGIYLKDEKFLQLTLSNYEEIINYMNYKIVIRNCYRQIHNDILENIGRCRSKNKDNKNIAGDPIKFIPQNNFLIEGNKGMGKTSLCIYLSYIFRKNGHFSGYDIIIIAEKSNTEKQQCFVRYGGENNFTEHTDIPPRRRPTIVISDNVSIHEDDFSDDDIIIMISSPKAEKYKVFRNKRYPIQYFIPQLEKDDLREVLRLHLGDENIEDNYKKATQYGGNLLNMKNSPVLQDMLDKKLKEGNVKCNAFIPEEYDEDVFIYDTNEFNETPTRLRFMSEEIKNYYMLLQYNDKELCKTLFEAFDNTEDGKNGGLFESLIHILLENQTTCTEKMRVKNMMGKINKVVINGHKMNLDSINDSEIPLDRQYYVNFSTIPNFPGIDGILLDSDAIFAVQMTASRRHDTKNNVVVYCTVYFIYF